MVNKKEDNLLHTQGMYYEFDGIKFKSKEDLESYKKSPKKSEKEISEEKILEDAKAEADRVAKEKAEADRVAEVKRKAKEAEERINLDKARTMMDQEFKEEKLEQNEKLAKLRAGVSLAKSGAGNTIIGIDD